LAQHGPLETVAFTPPASEFRARPSNRGRNRNIHRPDYLLQVRRVTKQRVSIVLETNKPYSYLRIRRSEVEPLVQALRQVFGGLNSL
jgi:hypothetical protein